MHCIQFRLIDSMLLGQVRSADLLGAVEIIFRQR